MAGAARLGPACRGEAGQGRRGVAWRGVGVLIAASGDTTQDFKIDAAKVKPEQ